MVTNILGFGVSLGEGRGCCCFFVFVFGGVSGTDFSLKGEGLFVCPPCHNKGGSEGILESLFVCVSVHVSGFVQVLLSTDQLFVTKLSLVLQHPGGRGLSV